MEQSLDVRAHVNPGRDAVHEGRFAAARGFVAAAYDEHERELFSFALRTTRDSLAAEDVVQEAFLRLARMVARGRAPDNVRAWLYRVVTNIVVSRQRRTSIAERFRHLFVVRETVEPPDEAVLRRERSDLLERQLAKLRPDARAGLLMAAEGFSMREIGDALGRSEGSTRTMLCRARLELRRSLEASESFDERS